MTMVLEVENAYFNRHREQWIAQGQEGLWAVVFGEELLGFYPTLDQAYEAGQEAAGDQPFLAKKVTPRDEVEVFHRVYFGGRGQEG